MRDAWVNLKEWQRVVIAVLCIPLVPVLMIALGPVVIYCMVRDLMDEWLGPRDDG